MDTKSYEAHNAEYTTPGKLEWEISRHKEYTSSKGQFNKDNPLGRVLEEYGNIKIGVDLGCGSGWAANLMSETLDSVYGIEPSSRAVEIGKTIYPNNKKIHWINAYAQDGLKKISLNQPAIFNASCVLSHIEDSDVSTICKEVDKTALPGSILCFSECYGTTFHGNLWHIRTTEWWQNLFPAWDFIFNGEPLEGHLDSYKGFYAIKRKNLYDKSPEEFWEGMEF